MNLLSIYASRICAYTRGRAKSWAAPLLLLVFVAGTVGTFWHVYWRAETLYQNMALQGTAIQVLTLEEFRRLYSEDLVERVRRQAIDVTHDDGSDGRAIPLPATLTMKMGQRLNECRPGAHVRLFSDHPFSWRKGGGPRDDFEREALRVLKAQPDQPFYRFERFEGRPSLRYAVADRMQAGCVACHNSHPESPKTDWRVGDVRGVLEFIRPLDQRVAVERAAQRWGIALSMAMAGLGVVGLGLVHHQLRRSNWAFASNAVRTRAILESALDCIITIDDEGRILEFNPAAETTFGLRRDYVLGQPLSNLIVSPADREADGRGLLGYLAPKEGTVTGRRIEITALRADGTEFPAELALSVFQGSGPAVFTTFLHDITERKLADETNARLAAIVDWSDDAIIGKDLDGTVTSWNTAAERLFGYSAAEIVGRPISLLIPPDRQDEEPQILARIRRGECVDHYEAARITKGGRMIDVALTISPIRDGAGRIVGVSKIARDITERKRAERERDRRARMARMAADVGQTLTRDDDLPDQLRSCAEALVRHLEAAFARIWTLGPGGDVLELQASAGMYTHLDGAHARVPVGRLKIGLIAQEQQPHLTNEVMDDPRIGDREWARREGMVAFAGYPLLIGDRLVGVMALFARRPLDGDVFEAMASIADTVAVGIERRQAETALRESEAALRQARDELEARVQARTSELRRLNATLGDQAQELTRSNAELRQFAYVASHDLQEPLRMVSSYTKLLARRYQGRLDADANEFIGYAADGADRMQQLINDLLAYSRIGTLGKAFALTPADPAVERAVANLQTAIEESSATVTHDPLPTLRADAGQLVQLFQNLIGNAIKYRGEEPPRVHVSAVRDGAGWRFAVRDNGIGIDPQYAERVFEVFQRLHTRAQYPGTGIGLAICRKIVERHGGRIWVESQMGMGATFYFTFQVDAEGAGRDEYENKEVEEIAQ